MFEPIKPSLNIRAASLGLQRALNAEIVKKEVEDWVIKNIGITPLLRAKVEGSTLIVIVKSNILASELQNHSQKILEDLKELKCDHLKLNII